MPENSNKKESQHIKNAGLKVTSPRVKILEMLENRSDNGTTPDRRGCLQEP